MSTLVKKDIKYVNKDFGQFRQNLIDFSKVYFPNTYNDFNESSPGMLFIEMASYVGDVLGLYTDIQNREALPSEARNRSTLYLLSHALGNKVKTKTPAYTVLDVYQQIPAFGTGASTMPNWNYALNIEPNAVIQSTTGVKFRTLEYVDFSFSSSISPTEVTVYQISNSGQIEYYLLKKQVPAVSGEIKTATYEFTSPKIYDKIVLPEVNVLDIISVSDRDGNVWYEVPYLAQDVIPVSIQNIPFNDPTLSAYHSTAPYILKYTKTSRRFVTRLRADNKVEMQFGAGISSEADEDLIPNPTSIGAGLTYFERAVDMSIDPTNFLYTKTYGQVPANATLTVQYSIGGGIKDNVAAGLITQLQSITYGTIIESVDATALATAKASVAFSNPEPARGGTDARDIESIRQDMLSSIGSQNRAVTKEDYIFRCFAMPAKFGSIAKAYITNTDSINTRTASEYVSNPYGLDLYLLGYNSSRNFATLNEAILENVRNYLKQYRLLTDSINIKAPYIINIGVEFEIITSPGYNSNEVLLKCIDLTKKKFDNDNMAINMPIIISNYMSELDSIPGVQTVSAFNITNLYDINLGYSGNIYDIQGATRNNIVYPSLDPSIFEIKYPNADIRGRVISY